MKGDSAKSKEMSSEERSVALNQLFHDTLIPLIREINNLSVDAEADQQLFYWLTMEYEKRYSAAELMKQRFETITREFQTQNNDFLTKHEAIKKEEVRKREEIMAQIQQHIEKTTVQMNEDKLKSE